MNSCPPGAIGQRTFWLSFLLKPPWHPGRPLVSAGGSNRLINPPEQEGLVEDAPQSRVRVPQKKTVKYRRQVPIDLKGQYYISTTKHLSLSPARQAPRCTSAAEQSSNRVALPTFPGIATFTEIGESREPFVLSGQQRDMLPKKFDSTGPVIHICRYLYQNRKHLMERVLSGTQANGCVRAPRKSRIGRADSMENDPQAFVRTPGGSTGRETSGPGATACSPSFRH